MMQTIAIYGGYAALILAIAGLVLFLKFVFGPPPIPVRAAPVPKRQTLPGPIIVHLAVSQRLERSPEQERLYREAKAQWELWAAIEDMTR